MQSYRIQLAGTVLALAGVSNKHGSFPSCSLYEALPCLGSARGHVQEQRKPPGCRAVCKAGMSLRDLVATFLRAHLFGVVRRKALYMMDLLRT